MRIVIMNVTGGGMSGGYKKYLFNMLPRIAAHPEVEAVLCVAPDTVDIGHLLGRIPKVTFAGYPPSSLMGRATNPGLLAALGKFAPEVIFIPVERAFRFNHVPVVTMLQNMEPLAGNNEGNHIPERIQHWFRAYLAKQGIRKADRVIAISQFVKEYLIRHCGVAEDKIGLIHYGASDTVRKPARPPALPASWENEGFIFAAGSIRPARGLEDIFLAMRSMRKQGNVLPKLLLAGTANPNMRNYERRLKQWIKKLGLTNNVFWAGHLDDAEMAWCYLHCKLFIMSSRIESFGHIALEAMSYGCTCISADNPCLPEVFGDAAIYYTPKDSPGLGRTIASVINLDAAQTEKLAIRAKTRAAAFSWDTCAMKTVAELSKAIKTGKKQVP